MRQKNNYPFRLGCTSFVYPDTIVPNVEKMAPVVDDIEIVLFESREYSNLPDPETISVLAQLAEEYDITYTVHFPIDIDAGSTNALDRRAFIDQAAEIINLTRPIEPYGYLLHFQGISADSSGKERELWHDGCEEVCGSIAKISDFDSANICVENLKYPMEWHLDLVEKYGFSLCIDSGHAMLQTKYWQDMFTGYIHKTRIIHLHGVRDGKDHLSLRLTDPENIKRLLNIIEKSKYNHVITLELFDTDSTFESLEVLGELWQALH